MHLIYNRKNQAGLAALLALGVLTLCTSPEETATAAAKSLASAAATAVGTMLAWGAAEHNRRSLQETEDTSGSAADDTSGSAADGSLIDENELSCPETQQIYAGLLTNHPNTFCVEAVCQETVEGKVEPGLCGNKMQISALLKSCRKTSEGQACLDTIDLNTRYQIFHDQTNSTTAIPHPNQQSVQNLERLYLDYLDRMNVTIPRPFTLDTLENVTETAVSPKSEAEIESGSNSSSVTNTSDVTGKVSNADKAKIAVTLLIVGGLATQ